MQKPHYTLLGPLALLLFLFLSFGHEANAQIANQNLSPASSSVCEGDSTTISTAGSDGGVSYWLRNDADSSIVDGPVIGSGGPLSFNTGSLSTTTSFHVYAEKTSMAMDFDGIDDMITTTSIVPWDNSSTLMAWYKSSDANSGAIFTWGSPVVNNYATLEFRYVNTTFNYIRFYKPQSSFPGLLPNPNSPTDWHHVAVVQNGTATDLFLDGQLVATGFVPAPTNPTQTSLGGGLFNGSNQLFYDGLIDELSYWDTVLTPTQIQQYMNGQLAGNEPNLSLYYSFESINGTTLPDESTGGNDGQMMNMSANPLVQGVFNPDSAYMNQIVTITVNSDPMVSGGANQSVCTGDSLTLNGSGASTYLWDNNVTDGVPFVPTATTTYTVTGTDGNNCSATAQVTITLDSLPLVTTDPDQTICPGDTVTLNGAGASTYAWDQNVTNGVPFAPTATNTYTVTGTDGNNCSATAQVTVTVNTPPNVSGGDDLSVCLGDSVTLLGMGASTYTWDNMVMNGVAFGPTTTADYVVTGVDTNGCEAMDTMTVTVVIVDATVSVAGNTLTANAVNATYQWLDCDNGMAAIPGETNMSFSPSATGNYALAVTEMGCMDTSACENVMVTGIESATPSIDLKVFPNPTSGLVTLTLEGVSQLELKVQIVNVQGKVVFQTELLGNRTKEIDLRGIPAGIYFLKVQGMGVSTYKKIVLQ